MNYYIISIIPEQAGCVPQCTQFIGFYQYDGPNSFRDASERLIIGDLVLPEGVKMEPKAKWTDMIRIIQLSVLFCTVSKNFLDIIQSCHLPPSFEVFPIKIHKKDKIEEYYIFVAGPPNPEYIDFSRSPASTLTSSRENREIWVKDYADYLEHKKVTPASEHFGISNPKLNLSAIQYDIFRLGQGIGAPYYFVSERLVEKAEKAGLVGVQFIPISDPSYNFI